MREAIGRAAGMLAGASFAGGTLSLAVTSIPNFAEAHGYALLTIGLYAAAGVFAAVWAACCG